MKALFAAAAALLVLALYLDRHAAIAEPPKIWEWYCNGPCKETPPPITVARLRAEDPSRASIMYGETPESAIAIGRSPIPHAPQEPLMLITINGREQVATAAGVLQRGTPPPGLTGPVVGTAQVWCMSDDRVCLRKLAHHWCSVEMPSSYRCRKGYDFAHVLGADD